MLNCDFMLTLYSIPRGLRFFIWCVITGYQRDIPRIEKDILLYCVCYRVVLPFWTQCFRGLWSINWMVGAIEEIHFRWDCLIKLVLIFYLLLDGTIVWEKFWNMNSVSVSYLFTVQSLKPFNTLAHKLSVGIDFAYYAIVFYWF